MLVVWESGADYTWVRITYFRASCIVTYGRSSGRPFELKLGVLSLFILMSDGAAG